MKTKPQPEPKTDNVVSLVRVSTGKQAKEDKDGLPRQRRAIETHCKRNGLNVIQEFALEGISGTKVQDSKEYKEMLRVLARPDVEGIVFATLDRFFRPEDISTFSDVFKPIKGLGDKALYCDLGELHPFAKGPEAAVDNMKLQIWGAMGGFERANIRNRMGEGMATASAQPDTCTRKRPQGVEFKRYNERVNLGVFGFSAYARTVIAPAFKRIAQGDKPTHVVRDMVIQAEQNFGIKIGYNNHFGDYGTKSLRDTLKSRWWLGEKPNGSEWVKANFSSWTDPKLGEITAEPIITEELWQRVQDVMANQPNNWTKRGAIKGDFLAAGLLFCGKCGAKMYHKYKKAGGTRGDRDKKYPVYVCSSRDRGLKGVCDMPRVMAHGKPGKDAALFGGSVPMYAMKEPGADDLIAAELERQLSKNPEIAEAAIREAQVANQTEEKRAQLAVAERTVRDLERQRANAIDSATMTDDPELRQSFVRKAETLKGEIATAKSNAAVLAAETKAAIDPHAAATRVREIFENFAMLPRDGQRVLLERHVEKIIYNLPSKTDAGYQGNIEVKLKLSGEDCQADSEAACWRGHRA